jgi:hypothetical protein
MKTITAIGVVLSLCCVASAHAVNFYVAPGGNDAHPGTQEQPFATIEHARESVRKVKPTANAPITVFLRAGTYSLDAPLLFGPQDSGTKTCPITYSAYPGEKPILSGGKAIAGWKRQPNGVWTAEIPEVKQGQWYFRQLFVNGQRRPRARLPREGKYTVAGQANPPARSFTFNPGEIDPKWTNFEDVELVLLQFWTEARPRIEAIDPVAHTVRFTGDVFRSPTWSNGWYVENVFEGLTEPGQWYLNRRTGTLYYRPLPGEDVKQLEIVAPRTKQWLRLEGDYKTGKHVEYVTFRGLTFHYSQWELDEKLGYNYPQAAVEWQPVYGPLSEVPVPSAIYVKGARQVRFEDNEIAHTGAWAIHLAQGGCNDDAIVGNNMRDLGAGAVRIGGPFPTNDPAEESGRAIVTDNRIHDCAKVYLGAPAVWIGQSSGNRVAHNEITGWCEWAISVGWSWDYSPNNARDNIVEYNHCHHIGGSVLGTHAVLYFLGVQPGTVVRNNLVHEVAGDCFLLDNGSVGIVIERNLFHHATGVGLGFNFNTFGNIVQNNIVALTDNGLMCRGGDPGRLDQTGVFHHNIFYYHGDKGRLFFPDNRTNDAVVMDKNLYYDASGKPVQFLNVDFVQWKQKGLDHSSIVADPQFIDPQKGDFRLKTGSPARTLGFQPIDLTRVGIRPREQRHTDEP